MATTSTSSSRAKKTPWKDSNAKVQLWFDISEGRVTEDDDPDHVYNMWPELYQDYEGTFKRSLASLLKQHAEEDCLKKLGARCMGIKQRKEASTGRHYYRHCHGKNGS
jgi:hypothetical protein